MVAYSDPRPISPSLNETRGVIISRTDPASADGEAAANDEAVFRALAHPVRRAILDLLSRQDGLTLKELAEPFDMTRQGCSKHIAVLEEARLVVSRPAGKEKHHYLNAAPVQSIYDRWVSRYARPWVRAMGDLKRRLESEEESMALPELIVETYIETTPERLWQALTRGDDTERYYFGTRLETSLEPGSPYRYLGAEGRTSISGTIVSADPPRELVMTFLPGWVLEERTRPSRATFTIEQRGALCKLTLVHDRIDPEDSVAGDYRGGWAQVLAGLKTLLETGRPMALPG